MLANSQSLYWTKKNETPLPARIYTEDDKGHCHFVQSTAKDGSAVRYNKANWIQAQ
jgi:hypothetical protein